MEGIDQTQKVAEKLVNDMNNPVRKIHFKLKRIGFDIDLMKLWEYLLDFSHVKKTTDEICDGIAERFKDKYHGKIN